MASIIGYGLIVTGGNSYAKLLDAPTGFNIIQNVAISVGTHPAIISFNGGTADQLLVHPGNVVIYKLDLPAAEIQAKNAISGSNFTNLSITIF
jgi:hypothetical protein